jgi:hypothetical protein
MFIEAETEAVRARLSRINAQPDVHIGLVVLLVFGGATEGMAGVGRFLQGVSASPIRRG